MAKSLFKTVSFGSSGGGLASVGCQVYDCHYIPVGARINFIPELATGSGVYGALVPIPANFRGYILWDTGDGAPPSKVAVTELNVIDRSYISG